MGMFDDVLLDPGVKCKKCDRRITYFQTKDFVNILDKYVEDKQIPDGNDPIKHKLFSCLGQCPCEAWYTAVGLITDNIFRGIVEYWIKKDEE